MKEPELSKAAGGLVLHLVAGVLGPVLMVAGLGMSVGVLLKWAGVSVPILSALRQDDLLRVSLVLLSIGLPVGLAGCLVFTWGLFGSAEAEQEPTQPLKPT